MLASQFVSPKLPLFLISYELLQERVKEASSQRLERYRSYLFLANNNSNINNKQQLPHIIPLSTEVGICQKSQSSGIRGEVCIAMCILLVIDSDPYIAKQ